MGGRASRGTIRIRNRLITTAPDETVFRRKHNPSPMAATITPPIAGPTVRVKLNIIALKAIAWRKSSRPTMSTVKDCRVGTSIAVMMPSASASTMMIGTLM